MDQTCGQTIQLQGDKFPGTHFSLSSGHYPPNLACLLTIKAATTGQRIIVVVDKMDVACGGDKILIYDGKRDASALLNRNASSQCGTSKYYFRVSQLLFLPTSLLSVSLQTATSNTAIIEFVSNADGKVGNGFMINAAINFRKSTLRYASQRVILLCSISGAHVFPKWRFISLSKQLLYFESVQLRRTKLVWRQHSILSVSLRTTDELSLFLPLSANEWKEITEHLRVSSSKSRWSLSWVRFWGSLMIDLPRRRSEVTSALLVRLDTDERNSFVSVTLASASLPCCCCWC